MYWTFPARFVHNYTNGKLRRYRRSSEVSTATECITDPNSVCVLEISADTFNDVVMDNSKVKYPFPFSADTFFHIFTFCNRFETKDQYLLLKHLLTCVARTKLKTKQKPCVGRIFPLILQLEDIVVWVPYFR